MGLIIPGAALIGFALTEPHWKIDVFLLCLGAGLMLYGVLKR